MAVNGSPSGNGSIGSPWDLATALGYDSSLHPGDTLWLRGGTYAGTFTSHINGTASSPIVVRQYPGEHVIIDGGSIGGTAMLTVGGSYTWFWGFEIMSSDANRVSAQTGSWPTDMHRSDGIIIDQSTTQTGPGLKFINLIIHDARSGMAYWKEAVDSEVHGCLIYYNGWHAPDGAHGHGIYTQNHTGTKQIYNNIVFSQFSYGIHAYGSSSAYLDNFDLEGNTLFNNGISDSFTHNTLIGGGVQANNPTLISNYFYYPNSLSPSGALKLGSTAICATLNLTDNYIANGIDVDCTPKSANGNTFYGDLGGIDQAGYPDNTYYSSRPTGVKVFVRPNAYEPGRANITVYNWDLQNSVSVDLSGVLSPGSGYEIRNAQDFFAGPVVTGIYDGNPVSVPMTGLSVASPIGWPAPPPAGPEFNSFVLIGAPSPDEFVDVSPSNPFHNDIVTLARNGVTAGCGGPYYCPGAVVRRDQMAVFLLKGEHGSGYAPPSADGAVFDDVSSSAFAASWIERLFAEGVTTGCGNGNYCPGSSISRAQMAVFLLKAKLGASYAPPPATGSVFSDVPANGFAAAWIEDLAARGITSGCGGGRYCPTAGVNRAQMATLLVRTFALQ